MKQNKFLWYFATAIMAVILYGATFDLGGNFDPVFDYDVVEYRLGARVGVVAEDANQEINRQNREMQAVANGREDRVERRVKNDTEAE